MTRQHPIELFMPPNMLKAKVGGGLGGMDMAAMKRAESAMDGLKNQFGDWIASDVRALIEARAAYAKSPDADTRGALLRRAHDIKGQAPTFDFPLIKNDPIRSSLPAAGLSRRVKSLVLGVVCWSWCWAATGTSTTAATAA